MVYSSKSRSWLKVCTGAIFLAACLGGFYYYQQYQSDRIVDFNFDRDAPFILESFKRDWYWLIEGNDYSPDYLLKYRASSQKPEHLGNATIKVGYQDKKPVGFVVYFMKSFYLGDLRFIDLNPEFRSKGWAYKLLDYAVKDLIKRGASKIELVTRTTNFSAQKLYTRYGFREASRYGGFVYYEYLVPSNT